MHAGTFIYGINEKGEKYVVFIDPYFYDFADVIDVHCFTASLMRYVSVKLKNVKIYAQSDRIQRDSNSCSTISLELIRMINGNPKIVSDILIQSKIENKKSFSCNNKNVDFFKYSIPSALHCLKQKISSDQDFKGSSSKIVISSEDIKNYQKNRIYHKELFLNEYKVNLVRQFSPDNRIYDDAKYLSLKLINTLPLKRAYQYSKIIKDVLSKKKIEIIDHKTDLPMTCCLKFWNEIISDPDCINTPPMRLFRNRKKNFNCESDTSLKPMDSQARHRYQDKMIDQNIIKLDK